MFCFVLTKWSLLRNPLEEVHSSIIGLEDLQVLTLSGTRLPKEFRVDSFANTSGFLQKIRNRYVPVERARSAALCFYWIWKNHRNEIKGLSVISSGNKTLLLLLLLYCGEELTHMIFEKRCGKIDFKACICH